MPEFVSHCSLCGTNRSRLFDQRNFHGQSVRNRLCLNCGLVYQSPRMTAQDVVAFYAAEYRRMYQGNEDPIKKDLVVQRARAAALIRFVRLNVEHVNRHLDIGCSAGLLLQEFQHGFGCEAVGVEPGKAYRTYAHGQGLSVHASLEDLKVKEKACFDLISLSHVLEHLPNPAAYLSDLRETSLAPGGWLLIEVPNLYAHDSFETAHLFSFSARTLARTVQQAGYETIQLETHGRPRSNIIPYYLTLLARARSKPEQIIPLRREKLVGLKRRFGLLRRRIISHLFPKKAWIEIS